MAAAPVGDAHDARDIARLVVNVRPVNPRMARLPACGALGRHNDLARQGILTARHWLRSRRSFAAPRRYVCRSEEHTSELQSRLHLVCRLLLEKKKKNQQNNITANSTKTRP